jgi:AcrR family transcriptional regulator
MAGVLFARQGYGATSTREIARIAQVSENTIYRIFESKENLFWSVLRSYFTDLKISSELLKWMAESEPIETVLPKIIELFTNATVYEPVLLRLVVIALFDLHWKGELFFREQVSPVFVAIHHYFALNIERGKLRELDATMLTISIIMETLAHAAACNLFDNDKPICSNPAQLRRAQTSFWRDMLAPRTLVHAWQVSAGAEEHANR